jgi:glucose-6-phosphate 1-dehydrogenase
MEKNSFLSRCYYQIGENYKDSLAFCEMRTDLERDNITRHDNGDDNDHTNRKRYNYLFYMATPPNVFEDVTKTIAESFHDLLSSSSVRFLYEKPFGKDLDSYTQLSSSLFRIGLKEEQIYRIDHYLGKQMVRAIPYIRFGLSNENSNKYNWLELKWNNNHISHVIIQMREPFGAEERGYFNEYGIIRDVIQNHLLQIMCLIAMERPTSFEKANHDDIRDAKCNLLKQIKPPSIDDCVLGQYEGYLYNGEKSHTPTYAAIKLWVENERWRGIPFYLIAGKALDKRLVEVNIGFQNFYRSGSHFCRGESKNRTNAELLLQIQPQQILQFTLNEERKGYTNKTIESYFDAISDCSYKDEVNGEYSTLILDSLRGDSSSFVRDDELQRAWEIFTPLLHDVGLATIYGYAFGSAGPKEVEKLLSPFNQNEPDYFLSRL